MSQPQRIAFIGLGVMGFPMAGHLAQAGHIVQVYNRSPDKAVRWTTSYPGTACDTPREAAAGCELIALCVGNDEDIRAVMYGDDGILAGAAAGATIVDHTTASAAVAREIDAACRQRGLRFLDAPVSGGQVGAENGALTIMVGGEPDTFAQAQPLLNHYARAVTLMGPVGSGQLTKMVNQIAIAGLLQGLSEALAFSEHAGLDSAQVLDVICKGAAQSWQMENRGSTMITNQFDFGFAVEWMRKDLSICLDEARRNGSRLPVTALVDQFYAQIVARGGKRQDTSSLIQLLKD